MQFVRCGACGAKALPAASSCPLCAEPLRLHNDNGSLVPLVRCRSCNTHFPRSQGACRWCASKRGGSSWLARRWVKPTAIGAVVLVAGVGAVLVLRRLRERALATAAAGDVQVAPSAGGGDSPMVTALDTTSLALQDSARRDTIPARVAATTPPPVADPAPDSTEWVSAIARISVNARAAPDRASRTVRVIAPNTPVELGEAKRGWRRVRIGALTGWVDPRLFAVAGRAR